MTGQQTALGCLIVLSAAMLTLISWATHAAITDLLTVLSRGLDILTSF